MLILFPRELPHGLIFPYYFFHFIYNDKYHDTYLNKVSWKISWYKMLICQNIMTLLSRIFISFYMLFCIKNDMERRIVRFRGTIREVKKRKGGKEYLHYTVTVPRLLILLKGQFVHQLEWLSLRTINYLELNFYQI